MKNSYKAKGGRGNKTPFSLKGVLGAKTDGAAYSIAHRWQTMTQVSGEKAKNRHSTRFRLKRVLGTKTKFYPVTGCYRQGESVFSAGALQR